MILGGMMLVAGSGCGAELHLTKGYGSSFRDAFALQPVNKDSGRATKGTAGLDSQEAAVIAKGYRMSLMPEEETAAEPSPILLLSPPPERARGDMPPPSVPR